MSARERFEASVGFELDDFQVRALDAMDAGKSVLVAAPTGSGKTVVAEYAVAKAVHAKGKAFYTTPLKALSNQKYGDLVRRYGPHMVGLLTGDNVINGEAPIVVMTTEVLRNMIYARSSTLVGLRYVVLDEVHFLQNAYRGPVWEEVIIHTPPDVDLVCLSATVSNAEQVADWIATVRGSTEVIIEERRPVELHNLFMVGDRHHDEILLFPTLVGGRPNPEADQLDRQNRPAHAGGGFRGARGPNRGRFGTPRRSTVIEALHERDMLPAIYFIFSRAGCNEAVQQCLRDGIRLTSPEERAAIRRIVEAKVDHLSDDDLRVLDYADWITGLEAGLAAHHAGMVPPFKEAVEACFAEALVKVVFATETLAMGINMPARSVVIEKLTKFTGETHEKLSPGEYTQLTGRAGRRGIDNVGYGIVLWSPFVPFDQIAGLVTQRSAPLTSAFRPTYNMAANLVRRYPADVAHHLLNLSFAQYLSDSEVVRDEARLEKVRNEIAASAEREQCELGDFDEYARLREEADKAGRIRSAARIDVERALGKLGPGDVLAVPDQPSGRVAVVATAQRRAGIRLDVVNVNGRRDQLTARDFPAPPRAVAKVDLPQPYNPRSKHFIDDMAKTLRKAKLRGDGLVGVTEGGGTTRERGRRAIQLAEALATHPVAECPDLRKHVNARRRRLDDERELRRLERTIRGRNESLARQFDRVLRVLEAWGYVDGWRLTEAGERLASLYHECDLLVCEGVRSGLFDELTPPEVAALASAFTYEARGPAGPGDVADAWLPKGKLRGRWADLEYIARQLNLAEAEAGLPPTRYPDMGFAGLAHDWARGMDLAKLLVGEEMTGGDFVRNVKQLIDLLRQLDEVPAARTAADGLFRGVVAASSVVTT